MSTAVKPRLLIVDDEPLVCRSLARAFRRTVDVSTAENAGQARVLLGTSAFDIVLSDFALPGENGLQLLSWVAAEAPLVRRVLMTGDETPPGTQEQLERGVIHATLSKPFNVDRASAVLGITSMQLAALKTLGGAFSSSLSDLPIVQVVMHTSPAEAELRAMILWQQSLFDLTLKHALFFIIEPGAGSSLFNAASVAKWFASLRSSPTLNRTAMAIVSSSRLERMALSAAHAMSVKWPVKTFAPDGVPAAVEWLRSMVERPSRSTPR